RFLPLIFFPASNPCGSIEAPFFRASHALAVDDGGGRAGLAFGLLATLFVERVMDAIQCAINAPIAKVTIDSAARRQILGKVTPLASRAQHVHDGVERTAHSSGEAGRPQTSERMCPPAVRFGRAIAKISY